MMEILTPGAITNVIFNCANCANLFASITDLEIVNATNQVKSAGQYTFTSADIGRSIITTSGTGFTKYAPTISALQPGLAQQAPFITAVLAGVATLSQVVNNAIVAAPIGTVGSTGGSCGIGYCTVLQTQEGDDTSFSQVLNGSNVPIAINYAYQCPACGVTTSGEAPLSYLQIASAGKHPTVIQQDGDGIVTATLEGLIWNPPPQ